MKKKKTNLIIVGSIVALIVVMLGVIAVFGFKTPDNSAKHLQSILNHRFKGDSAARAELVADVTVEEFAEEYETSIRSFVKANILSGTEVDETTEKQYVDQCKKLFASLKYEIGKSKEIEEDTYQVTVTYQPTDFFMKFIEAANGENKRIIDKYNRSEYRGSEDEINAQMKKEYLENMLTKFEETRNSMELGATQTMVFHLTKTKQGVYSVNDGEIAEFTIKILRLDEIQD